MFAQREWDDQGDDGEANHYSMPRFRLIGSPDTSHDLVDSVSRATRSIQESTKAVADAGIDQFGGEDLADAVLALEKLRRGLDNLSLTLLGELHARGTTDEVHGMRTGPWLAREAGLPRGSAQSRVRIATKLRTRFQAITKALDEGRIGYHHAETLIGACNDRIEDQWEAALGELIDDATQRPFNHWRNHVRAVAELLDQDGGHQPGDDITDNSLHLSSGYGGTLQIQGQLAGEHALVVSKLIESRADELFRRYKNDSKLSLDLDTPPRRTLLALALAELVRESVAKPKSATSGPKPEVSLVINAQEPHTVTDTLGFPIGNTAASTLLCDPVFRPIVVDFKGVVTDLGNTQRLASLEQRKAVAHRDGGCTWPGCENPPSWTDAHHVWHWILGGPTDLANIASLCRYHHGVTHRKGWKMFATADQWFWWQSPTGNTFWSQRYGRQRTGPTPGPAPGPPSTVDEPDAVEHAKSEPGTPGPHDSA